MNDPTGSKPINIAFLLIIRYILYSNHNGIKI